MHYFESEDDDGYCDGSVKERDTVALPVKRKVLVNRNLLHGSVKKSKLFPSPVDDDDDDDDVPISWRIKNRSAMSTDKSFSFLREELEFVEKSFEECKRKRGEEEKRLESVKRDIVECEKEFESKKKLAGSVRRINEIHDKMMGKIEGCVKDFVVKEAQLCLIEDLIGERKQELRVKEMELCQVMNKILKEREFKSQMKELLDDLLLKQKHFERRTKELELREKQHQGLVMKWELKAREFEGQVKELKSKTIHFGSRVEELKSKEMQLRGKVKEVETKEKELDGRVKEFDSKEDEFEGRVKELESEKKHFESWLKEFDSKEDEFEGQVKELESEKKHFECRVEELESEKKHFECRLKELESKENQFKEQMKVLQLKEEEFKGQVKVFELKEEEFKGRVKELESEKKHFESKKKQLEERWKDLESKEKLFEGQVIKIPEPKLNKHEEKESATSYMDDALSPTIDETSLQLVPCEQTDILSNLRESSDPAKVVLDIILNPILPLCDKNGVNAVNIDKRSIYLLELLMQISPNIKPCVREEAMKLALDLKATIKENTEKNSLAVLGFQLVLSIYGLVTSFDQDEVSELFASVAQHRIAWELFRPLGFCK